MQDENNTQIYSFAFKNNTLQVLNSVPYKRPTLALRVF